MRRNPSVTPLQRKHARGSSDDYIYGPSGVPIEQVSETTGAPTYLYTDQLGSVVMEAVQSGNIVGTQSYSPYCSLASSTGTDPTPFGFAGGYTDATGLIYLINRYYDPMIGQFLSVDPLLGLTGTAYSYAQDDPINVTDPTGCGECAGLLKEFYASAALATLLSVLDGLCPTATKYTKPVDLADGLYLAMRALLLNGCIKELTSAEQTVNDDIAASDDEALIEAWDIESELLDAYL